jgi:hypothetical protein
MAETDTATAKHKGRIRDARGRRATQLDPVKVHLLKQRSNIQDGALRAMVDELLPGARRQRLVQLIGSALIIAFVVSGTLVYFRFFSRWKGFDPVNVSIYILQAVIIVAGPFVTFYIARAKYVSRIASVMMAHRHCPHCGYDLRGLPTEPDDGATICPECGCAWRLPDGPA